MDVNEKIVIAWLHECKKMFTINNIDYGQFHSDVDILAINLINKELWDCEIKVRTSSTKISKNNNKQNGFFKFVETLNDIERADKINEYLGKNKYKKSKKFITTKNLFGKKADYWVVEFLSEGIDVIFFEDILTDIREFAKKSKHSTNDIIQTLRLYGLGN